MKEKISIQWFRQDLRLLDNPSLQRAAQYGHILPIYILDDANAGEYALGGASRWWLHHSLTALQRSLQGNLSVYQGNPADVLKNIMMRFDVASVCWNRCYEPWRIQRDTRIKQSLEKRGILVHTCNGSLLWEPWNIHKDDGTHYKVFTPFYRKGCLNANAPRIPLPKPKDVHYISDSQRQRISSLNLLPKKRWDKKLDSHWNNRHGSVGEIGAHQRFKIFVDQGLDRYKDGRNLPSKHYVSRLSPHLHFGEISPHQLWHTVRNIGHDENIDHFCSELGWREFSYSQLYYHPDLPRRNLQTKFDAFPWIENTKYLRAWERGKTGVPMVDAGMRELWQTGYMHNRMRMIVGSFLVKNLRLHWHHGERWFWDTLVEADLASNSASWQWIAGCGADAAPYFRIFNPVTQGLKFDADGHYVRRYVPEISKLPNQYLFNPWEAPQAILKQSRLNLGSTYPKPITDLKDSRKMALEAFHSLR